MNQLEAGAPTVDQLQSEIDRLNGVNGRLQGQINEARKSADQGNRAIHALGVLRKELGPLHRSLLAIFGELDAVGVPGESMESSRASSGDEPEEWKSWKEQFGQGSAATKFIDALLKHRQLSAAQLRVHMQCSNQNVYNTVSKLSKLGLVSKNGGKYSLRASS